MTEPIKLVVVAQRKWFQSKTVWLNVVVTLVAVLGLVSGHLSATGPASQILAAIIALANIILRVWLTGSPLTDTGAINSQPPNTSA